MSGGSDSATSTTSIPSWVVPYAQNYMQKSQQVANLPYQGYGGQTVAQMNPLQTQGYNAQAQRAIQGSGVNNAAAGELQKTLAGGYLNRTAGTNPYAGANPYLQQNIDAASSDVTRNYNNAVIPQLTALDARSGSFGNTGSLQAAGMAQGELARNLGNIATGMRTADYTARQQLQENAVNRNEAAYQAERARMQGGVGMSPGIANQDYVDAQALQNAGQAFQTQNQANLTDQYNRFLDAKNYPNQQLDTLGKGLGFNFGQTSTTKQGGGK